MPININPCRSRRVGASVIAAWLMAASGAAHTILIQLVDANHQSVDQEMVRVTVPKRGQ
jgi:hypothetical protein